ncbi:MAG: class I SAM-dependent methyltransferase [Bacteroidota bacterium]
MNTTATQIFTDNWKVYQKVIQHDYMHHVAFGTELFKTINARDKPAGLSVLDIGCGDASQFCSNLQNQKLATYTGYDLSEPALMLAKENLAFISENVHLLQGDMQELLQQENGMFDIIYSSFAIHHLQDNTKQQLLQECYNHLNKNGILVYTDIFLSIEQSRTEYRAAYTDNMNSNWTMLNDSEKQLIFDHINTFDFPASINDVKTWLTSTGFTIKQIVQPDAWHYMIIAAC